MAPRRRSDAPPLRPGTEPAWWRFRRRRLFSGRFAFSPADADASASMKRPSSAPNASRRRPPPRAPPARGGKSAGPSSRRVFGRARASRSERLLDEMRATRVAVVRDRAGECAMPPGPSTRPRRHPNASASSAALRRQSSRRAVSGRAPTDDARDATARRRRRWRSRGRRDARVVRWSRWGSRTPRRLFGPRGRPTHGIVAWSPSSPTARRR